MRPVIPLVLLAGCGVDFRVDDSFASSIDVSLFGGHGDNRITSPYLRGAAFEMMVVGDADDIADLSLESGDETVLSIGPTITDPDDDGLRIAPVEALAPGTAAVRVVEEGGRERLEIEVRVGDPDRLTLHPVARLVQEDEREDTAPTVVVGGRAEVEVHPYDGDDLLVGSGWQAPASPTGLGVEASQYHITGLHDVLALTPTEAGAWTLAMPYAGGAVAFGVDAVAAGAVAALDLTCQDDEGLVDGDTLYCLSTATLADGTDVHGVAPTWDVGGTALTGAGDMLVVTYAPGDSQAATATFGALTTSVTVSGVGQSVSSTNDVAACASVATASPWAALVSLGLVLARRRSRPRRR